MLDTPSILHCFLTCLGEVKVVSSFEMVWVKAEERNDVVSIPVSPLQHLHVLRIKSGSKTDKRFEDKLIMGATEPHCHGPSGRFSASR